MKSFKTLFVVAALSAVSFGSLAQSISVTASTLDCAEEKIAKKAAQENASYTITSAMVNNRVHMTATLDK